VQSGVDKVVDPCQMIDFDKNSKSTDKTNFFVKDMWHAVCYDNEINEVMDKIDINNKISDSFLFGDSLPILTSSKSKNVI
jgi:hypothetical protein